METETNSVKKRTLKEYLKSSSESLSVFTWLYREATTPESRSHMRKLFVCIGLMVFAGALQPSFVSYIFDGLRIQNATYVQAGLAAFALSLVLQKVTQRFHDRSREYILGIHMGTLDDKLTTLFFGKSLGQHAQLSHVLSPTTIDKGKWKALDIQRVILFDGVTTVLQLGLSVSFLFFLNVIAGAIMASLLVCYVLGSLYLNNMIHNVCTPLDARFRALGRRRFERMERAERVLTNGKSTYEVADMAAVFGPLIREDRSFWLKFIDIALIRSGLNIIALSSVMALGAWSVWNGEMTLGLLFPLYAWASKVSENVWRLGDIEHQINWNLPPVQSMIKAVNLAPDIVDSPDAVSIDGTVPHRIEFVNVSHTYPAEIGDGNETPPAVKSVSFTIDPGEKVSLLGPSGAGKSTIMKKLLRFSDPTSGSILIDGIPLTQIRLNSWRTGIGYIPQQAQVLDGTIRYNLLYGLDDEAREKITDKELWGIMRLLKIDFGERLTQGLDTVVGKNGIKLSGGQAQRLMIGAAVIKKPWLLIIDEATSSLDSSTEKEVQEGLATVLAGRNISVLVVAHRLSTVRTMCNKHVVLRPAAVVEIGESQVDAIAPTFEELSVKSPIFARLASDQGIVIGCSSLVA